jgi:hypothetical protein
MFNIFQKPFHVKVSMISKSKSAEIATDEVALATSLRFEDGTKASAGLFVSSPQSVVYYF